MQNYEKLSAQAAECGFTHCAPLDVSTLEFLQDVRDMCNEKQCDKYGKSWSCPPACPSLEEMREKVLSYSGGILVQTVGELEDSYDWEGIMDAGKRHKDNFGRMREVLEGESQPIMAMGAGTCTICESCTYPDAPCRFPGKMAASMEACGLFVSKVCTDNGLKYNHGPNKIAFTSCYLVE
jgi:predicted metal-binding protein